MGINSRDLEYSRNQIWVERWLPRRRSGVPFKGIGKTLTSCDGTPNSAHLEAKAEIIIERLELIRMVGDDVAKAQPKRNHHHPQKRSPRRGPPYFPPIGMHDLSGRRCRLDHRASSFSQNSETPAAQTWKRFWGLKKSRSFGPAPALTCSAEGAATLACSNYKVTRQELCGKVPTNANLGVNT